MTRTSRADALKPAKPRDLCRVLVLRRDGSELLLRKTGEHLSFPTIAIPRWERPAENINAAVRSFFGVSAHCLFSPKISSPALLLGDHVPFYQVMEADTDTIAEPAGMIWAPETLLSENAFVHQNDIIALASARQELASHQNGSAGNSLGRPGWLRDLLSWVERKIAPLGLHLKGTVRQLNSGTGFALLRLETDGAAVWFKATGAPNRHERAVSVELAKLFPDYVPWVIAVHDAWNGWLTLEAEGLLLESDSHPSAWHLAAETLAKLQIASVGMALRLIETGCKDARICRLEPQIEPFLEAMAELMARQTKVPPYPLDRSELSVLGERIRWLCHEADELAVPDTLGHFDVNPGNIVTTRNSCIFLDWAEGCVGHPFVTFEYLRSHFRRTSGIDDEAGLFAAYLERWEHFMGAETVAQAQRLAPLLAVYTLAVADIAWQDVDKISNPITAVYLRSLTRRMSHEATHLNGWRLQCKH